jgi:hypothetical protein
MCNPLLLSAGVKISSGTVLQSVTCKSDSSVDQKTWELKVSEAKLTIIEFMLLPSERCTCSASQESEVASLTSLAAAYCIITLISGRSWEKIRPVSHSATCNQFSTVRLTYHSGISFRTFVSCALGRFGGFLEENVAGPEDEMTTENMHEDNIIWQMRSQGLIMNHSRIFMRQLHHSFPLITTRHYTTLHDTTHHVWTRAYLVACRLE